jgi:hypothetical protein
MADEQEPQSVSTVPPEVADDIAILYPSLTEGAMCSVIFARGAFAWRFGPMPLRDAGAVLKRANEEGIPCALTIQGGLEVDWNLALDLFGKGPAAKEEAEREAT